MKQFDSNAGSDTVSQQTNRRQYDRFAFDHRGRLTEIDELGRPTHTWNVRLVDLSRGGIGLRSRRKVQIGRTVLVECSTSEPGRMKLLYGVVKHSWFAESDAFAIGVQFRELPGTVAIRNWCTTRGLTL